MSLLPLAIASIYFVNAPHSVMRESPSDQAKVSSELYFSEKVQLLEDQGEWVKVQNSIDSYVGWVKKATLYEKNGEYPTGRIAKINRLRAHIYSEEDTERGPIFSLPFEAKVEVIEECSPRWLKIQLPDTKLAYVQRGDLTFDLAPLSREQMCALSHDFKGLPYTWGGRSSYLGYDCSGFVQMLYRQMGVFLPRDSKDQAKWEKFRECAIADLQPGDLLFWGVTAEKIGHVGMFLGNDEFIHATVAEERPYIHISKVSDPNWSGKGRYTYCTARTMRQI